MTNYDKLPLTFVYEYTIQIKSNKDANLSNRYGQCFEHMEKVWQ